MENITLIGTLFALGYVLQKLRIFPLDMPLILNRFVITIALPALILAQVPKLDLSMQMFIPPIIAWVVMVLSALAVLLFSRLMRFSRSVEGALLLVAVLTNSSFVGIPMITAYLGEESLGYLMMYDQLGTAIALSTYGALVVALYAHQGDPSPRAIARKILTFPPFIAVVVGLLLIDRGYPAFLDATLEALSATIIPLALISAGLQLQLRLPKEELGAFSVALFIKLALAPAIAIGLCATMDWQGMAAHVAIMEAGMAPMITAGVVASVAGLAPRLATSIVGYGILASFATSALLYAMII
ncbi:MAG: membrane protein [Sulfuricurvum sp. PC08-66]|nr:MAG: membrane protein [Sulfuricurvum sp. PC08-66]